MLDLRQTPQYGKYMLNIGWVLERKKGINYFIKKFSFLGSFIKIQRPEKIDFKIIKSLIKKYRAFEVVVEPKFSSQIPLLLSEKFKLSKTFFVPSKTVIIDLEKSEKQLLKEMHYKTRYNIKKAKSRKLKIESSNDILRFADFWQECAFKQRGMYLMQKKEIIELYKLFGERAKIITVSAGTKLLSGVLIICTKDVGYYMYAASTSVGKKLFAPTSNVWAAIKFSKKMGCKIFDFEGIYDERFPLKSWKGFTRFKKSFGGEDVEFPGTYRKFLLPFTL